MKLAAFCFVMILPVALVSGALVPAQQSKPPANSFSVTPHVEQPVSSNGYVRLKMVRIMDQTGLSEPTEVLRMFIPADWKFEGRAKWLPENVSCPENITAVTFRASSPDDRFALERFPETFWMWVSNAPADAIQRRTSCPLREPVSAEDYFTEEILPEARPGSRILSTLQLQEFSTAQKEQLERAHPAPLNFGNDVTTSADSVRINYEYLDLGQTIHEFMVGTIFSMRSRSDLWPFFNKGPKYADFYWIHASDIYATRAPQEDSQSGAVLARILASLRGNPRWSAGRDDVMERVMRSRPTAGEPLPVGKSDQATEKQIAESYRLQAQSQLTRARLYDGAARPMELFVEPVTKASAELNGGFAFAWCNNKDEYILTNDANFNPEEKFKESWTQLQRAASPQP